jgi:pyruvate formate lyase activating enzyme
MKIGGLQKHSLIDYPGRVSCVLFLAGCNFACPYCHNPQLTGIPGRLPDLVPMAGFFAFLEQRRGLLDGVVISGGEPTLQSGLAELCRRVKRLGFCVKIDTNGSRPQMLKRLIVEGLVDYIAMDIKTAASRYGGLVTAAGDAAAVEASMNLLLESDVDYEFRTTCVKPLISKDTIATIARRIQGCRLYALQRFKDSCLLDPRFFQGLDPSFSSKEMVALKRVADPHVAYCTLR